jgi:hypothetical protein
VPEAVVIIPVDAHFITLTIPEYEIVTRQIQVGRTTQPQRQRIERTREIATRRDERSLRADLSSVNRIWSSANIEFSLRSAQVERVQAPHEAEVVNPNTFLFLARQFPARNGVSLLLVSRFQSADLGGQAVEAQCVCILGDAAPATSLAHEFGHLLHLDHEGDIRNLMNGGLSIPDPQLTTRQILRAQQSPLARRFASTR